MTHPVKISAIVPTWNEAGWLPCLLRRLGEDPSVIEVIVADNDSSDGTVQIARSGNCKVVSGGLPAFGRNAGARAAVGSHLLFADADVVVTPSIMAAIRLEFADPGCALVHFRLVPVTKRPLVRFSYRLVDFYARLCHRLGVPQGSAPLICVRRDAFESAGGFDESVYVAEDVDFIRQVGRRTGGIRYVRSTPLYVSARRFEVESAVLYGVKCVMWGLLRMVGLRVSLRRYRWQVYPDHVSSQDAVSEWPPPSEVAEAAASSLGKTS